MKKPIKNQSGQAIVEYLLMLVMSIMIVSIIGISFRKSVMALWYAWTKDITAACPGCPGDPQIRRLK